MRSYEHEVSRVLEMVATNATLGESLEKLVRLVEAQAEGVRCSILLLDDDRRLRHGAAPSLPREYVKAIDGREVGPKAGSCGRAVFTGEEVITLDIATDPHWGDYRDLALPHGLRACWSTPILSPRGRVLGAFALYYGETRGPSTAERELVGLATHLAAIAIDGKRREDALRASEAKYRELYTKTPAMLHSIDRDGRLLSVSEKWAAALGYTQAEVIGRRSTDFMTPESQEYAKNVILPAFFEAGVCNDVSYQFVKKSGEVMEVLLSGIAERDADGSIKRSLAILVDVTERKRLEERLFTSQKLEALWRLAGGVAHDFNNILAAILVNTEVLAKVLPGSVDVGVGEIQRAVERGAALTRQLLAFSRKQLVEPRLLDVNEVVGSVEDMLRRLLREDVRLVTSLAPGLGRVKADRNQLEQVILNLVVNARDAMPQGGTLTIATGERILDEAAAREVGAVAPGSYVELAVRDTGVGMDDVTRARIFEPFFTTKEIGKGTGLGLATVDGIVRQSGGHVVVDTAPGRGTTFSVLLPRAADAAAPTPSEPRPVSGARGDETVLLVEDDASVRAGVRALLRQTGYTVLEAPDAREALRLAREHAGRIHVLVTDSVMPGMGGAELASQIEAARPGIGVVFISGYIGHDAPTPVPGRAGAFLPKPFTAAALTAKIREVVDRPR